MQTHRRIYLLDPQTLPPETIAVAFAKTSRSPEAFDAIAAELSEEKSAQFHEKWVVGYGHASVAEHAVLHIAVENVSRLAVECLESNRLASYTEKSTRYQQWDSSSYHTPVELHDHVLLPLFNNTIQSLFGAYAQFLPALETLAKQYFPQGSTETENAWKQRIRTKYIDVARFVLPAASLANVGVTINARALEHALQKMAAHPLLEVRQMGIDIRTIAQEEVPTLVKYITPGDHLENAANVFSSMKVLQNQHAGSSDCDLVHWDADGEDRVLAAALFRYQQIPYSQALASIQSMSVDEKVQYIQTILDLPEKYDIPIRELEHTNISFDVLLDQGAYFELKRHRMMTQSAQELSTAWGYALPKWIEDAGLSENYHQVMHQVMEAYTMIEEELPGIGSYLVPNAFNRRVLLTLNLRSMLHLVKLRCAENAHFSIRRMTGKMLAQLSPIYPAFTKYFQCYAGPTWQSLESEFFENTQCY